jgi:hypothetical protein
MIETVLDDTQDPIFARRCVVCGAANPRHVARFMTHERDERYGPDLWPRVPCCFNCPVRVHVSRIGRSLLLLPVVLAPAAVFVYGKSQSLATILDVVLSILVLGASAWLCIPLMGRFHPPFDLEYREHRVAYRFQNREVGEEFSNLNPPQAPTAPQIYSSGLPNLPSRRRFGEYLSDTAVGAELIRLVDKETGQNLGKISAAEFRFLTGELERESSSDRDFYIDEDTIAMIEQDGAPKSFVELLRGGLRGRAGYEVQW